ncbi:MAG: protein translocase subunit SecD [Candidatus Aquicultor secundus]|uniref:protein translocase subunit SecD n=1 Tax=Candidatus Aquicultor secundus TaxID=1973895 RepID=UPI000CB199D8|nr:protein translocase subunit SecD [Candidatus Aquicultor secundus]PIU26905.1 MAG: protein translocase subunit SecD [Candidatus Aquicultor secundus]PIW22044.1 MAG: protein translocase subunit SecD [Candidatus Aquicultor secundus]PIY41686.1 MAG: protein translocase subunit SecD [Candidatus Aquicultor secundus]PJB77317.1 MAG: protein translocase subunit SecD [Candidatus Aquicultor secundus]
MTDKTKHLLTLGIVFVLVVASVFMIYPVNKSTKLGLDLKGGLSIIYTAEDSPGAKVTDEKVKQAEYVLRERVDALGVAEPDIQREGARNIMVQLPGIKDPEKAQEILGKPAVLQFAIVKDEYANYQDSQLNTFQKQGKHVLGPVLLTGDKITSAKATYGGTLGQTPEVSLTFNREGANRFAQITAQNVNKHLAIVLDNNIVTAPNIEEAIPDGKAVINNIKSIDEAKEIALVLNTGSIPVTLKISQADRIGPKLGADALQAGVIAGLIGFTFVALYMLVYYQGLGLVTWVGLSVYATLVWGVVATIGRAYGWTLTLPGIAGLIISIGIAADSKIIIFERLKEEMRNKKTFRTAVDSGFWHGFRTSLDADLVTLFAAIVLFLVGIGEVRGFALTLIIGLSLDIFTMLFFTRPVLGLLAQVWPVKSPALLVRTGGVTKSA